MTDSALETALFAAAGTKQGHRRHISLIGLRFTASSSASTSP
jgi:hypothetical protein